ncbi:hypothetical protein FHS18_000960 [Paenibacillus phyllosphaerae]|uniref:Amidoligase enzyme n=1 Tax=Paenibacillus phyllosphaerae TaxID=274593 RepID=A0A7W5AUH7_9BACL|nr:amidoligase family protein [Paenibacillus phyllosphaerae]MBB3108908.1 hypothetical protein [Paenibacillus phyllosphaerae]
MTIEWTSIRFGVEIEYVGGTPDEVELLPGWTMARDELQIDDTGRESGSELQTPPLSWVDREQLSIMLERLQASGAAANWSCGLHVHVDLSAWGAPIVPALIDSAMQMQDALRQLLQMSPHRALFCPPVIEAMRGRFKLEPGPGAVRNAGRPQSHRCGINVAAFYDIGTVEIRYANGSLAYDEVIRTVELCLRFVAAVGAGAGNQLPNDPLPLARRLGAPEAGYPQASEPPRWYRERMWLEDALIPVFAPMIPELVPSGEIHHILPGSEGLIVAIENPEGQLSRFTFRATAEGWEKVV